VLTVAQVYELADRVGRRPVGNVRKLKDRAYRLRFQQHGEMRTHPEIFTTRADAERALWKMGTDGRVDCTRDRRFRAIVISTPYGVRTRRSRTRSTGSCWVRGHTQLLPRAQPGPILGDCADLLEAQHGY
jgi:hypothetical protein